MTLKLKGIVAFLDGYVDADGDSFSSDIQLQFPETIDLLNANGVKVGEVVQIDKETEGQKELIVQALIDPAHEDFYLRAAKETKLYLAIVGTILGSTRAIRHGRSCRNITHLQVTGIGLSFGPNVDPRVPHLTLEEDRNTAFEKAYDEAYGTRPLPESNPCCEVQLTEDQPCCLKEKYRTNLKYNLTGTPVSDMHTMEDIRPRGTRIGGGIGLGGFSAILSLLGGIDPIMLQNAADRLTRALEAPAPQGYKSNLRR